MSGSTRPSVGRLALEQRRRPVWVREALGRLPLDDAGLRAAVLAAERSAGAVHAEDIDCVRRANALARVLGALPRVEAPAGLRSAADLLNALGTAAAQRLDPGLRAALRPVALPATAVEPILDAVHDDVVERSVRGLRETPVGDLLAAGIAPVAAPADVDWAAAVVTDFEFGAPAPVDGETSIGRFTLGAQPRTPGWLWARIRGEVRGRVVSLRRRRRLLRASLVAAAVLVSALVWMRGAEGRAAAPRPVIVFQSVDQPLAEQYLDDLRHPEAPR